MSELAERIVLVGFMGAGKSTVGRLVARRLAYAFEDMDNRIEARAGRTIAAIFRDDGEAAFRALEREEAGTLSTLPRRVVAAGGGAFAQPETRALLQQRAVTVWLRCDLQTALARLPADGGARPLAANRDIMRALLAEREASYRMADVVVEAIGAPEQVAERVVALVRGRLRGEAAAAR
jgi:shikimate kinase